MSKPKTGVRDRILETALPLFMAHGFRASGIDRIIGASNVAKASFYRHFPSKNHLVLACLEQWHVSHFAALKARTETSEEKLRPLSVFEALGDMSSQSDYRGSLLTTALIELSDEHGAVRDLVITAKTQMRLWFETLLGAAGFEDMAESLSHEWLLLYDGATVAALSGGGSAARHARTCAERSLQQIQLKRLLSKTLPQ